MDKNNSPINWIQNRINVFGEVSTANLREFARALDVLIEKKGYQDVQIDFRDCDLVFAGFMLPIVALCEKRQAEGVDIELILPDDPNLSGLFRNANWAYYIDPRRHERSAFEGTQHVPAIRYRDPDEQHMAVDRVIDAILSSLSGINRSGLKALEWSLNEITDNVLNHAQTRHGGFVQASTFSESHDVEFVVADTGIGIPRSLGIHNHERALENAIKEGVTRDRISNAGNGLFGSYSVATVSGGRFQIHSGNASLLASGGDRFRIVSERRLSFPGTAVLARIRCSKEHLLEEALRFGDIPHNPPFDYIERNFESETDREMNFVLKNETKSMGSRDAGKSIKKKIENLIYMNPGSKICIDLDGISVISSSFADEVFGRLFGELGPIGFMRIINLKNVDRTVQSLIDRAITQRMQNGVEQEV